MADHRHYWWCIIVHNLFQVWITRLKLGKISRFYLNIRVSKVVADHDNHIECIFKWVNFKPIFFDRNYFQLLMGLRSFQKIRGLKVTYFHLPSKKNIPNWKYELISMQLLFLSIRLIIYVNFQKNISPKMSLKLCELIYKSIFA